ncbi:hypothetical protein EKD04_011845 [Chloroflexales bacterium ZM16-3]|nr:hypothetical protein [Chloroflexales bacterium ZM16-3]
MPRKITMTLVLLLAVMGTSACAGRAKPIIQAVEHSSLPQPHEGGIPKPHDIELPHIGNLHPDPIVATNEQRARQALGALKTSFEQVENVADIGTMVIDTHCYGIKRLQAGQTTSAGEYSLFLLQQYVRGQIPSPPIARLKSMGDSLVTIERYVAAIGISDPAARDRYIADVCTSAQ